MVTQAVVLAMQMQNKQNKYKKNKSKKWLLKVNSDIIYILYILCFLPTFANYYI